MNNFCVGHVIANSLNPCVKGFFCGSICDVFEDKYTIWYPGNIRLEVKRVDAVALRDVIDVYAGIDIIADQQYLNKNIKRFVGGIISSHVYGSGPDVHACIALPNGKSFNIMHGDRVSAITALSTLEPCPRSQNH